MKLWSLMIVAGAVLLSGCAKPKPYDYSAFRASKPASIVVLPATNSSPDVNAAHSVVSVVTAPLAESGYYVFPVAVVDKTFEQNGLSSAADAQSVSPAKLREIFNADAALYIDVSSYGTKFMLVDSVTEVKAAARLVDLRSGKQIWSGTGYATDAQDNNNAGPLGMLISAAIKQIASSVSDKSHDVAVLAAAGMLTADGVNGSILPGPRALPVSAL
ncbi:lipoprotein [bacteria symbiont BFo1 of Frankliniella occidentalis]|jgi:hypothetical protein|uniref:DUF799 domain-containing protein n=1 Tax=Erwinia aphidicola TaxID=68334 RepID=A0ABU8D9H0_ERWAP|nr:DUF799 domain-containing protein [Erwinia aphidicola]KMV69280.1 hypothetical protein AI28_12630 [bacteria symbiont BFo1 of Frankliniella occidentalis]PIJ59450.1 hypothetical protein BOM23_04055 [Erwinia sp. OLMDLW33]KYP84112.1 lipoprotein [bacteria symbiont BFo1 of Frankliniella occidentalis]KYP89491.1 lipoprotein [bacteria symbiont BFo1 of Frankliniella occidentalis]MBD1378233.1 DUF799 domain-containing protein [Erwinia aphidicola]